MTREGGVSLTNTAAASQSAWKWVWHLNIYSRHNSSWLWHTGRRQTQWPAGCKATKLTYIFIFQFSHLLKKKKCRHIVFLFILRLLSSCTDKNMLLLFCRNVKICSLYEPDRAFKLNFKFIWMQWFVLLFFNGGIKRQKQKQIKSWISNSTSFQTGSFPLKMFYSCDWRITRTEL